MNHRERIDLEAPLSGDFQAVVRLIIGGIALPEDRAGWAALFISFGIGSALYKPGMLRDELAQKAAAFVTAVR